MSQTIAGALVGGALGAFGKKVATRDLPQIDATKSQLNAIEGNLLNFDEASALTTKTNIFNQDELNRAIELQLPGGSDVIKQNLLAGLQGNLSPGTLSMIKRSLAESSVGGGYGGMFKAGKEAQTLGIASEKLFNETMNSAQKWVTTSLAPRLGVESMFFTPQQRLAFDVSERDKTFMADTRNDQIRAAPDPSMVALAEGFDNFFKTWSSIGTAAAGNAIGGGGSPKPKSGSSGMFTDEFSQGMF